MPWKDDPIVGPITEPTPARAQERSGSGWLDDPIVGQEPAAPQSQPLPRTRTEAVMRQLGLTGRAIAGGLAQAVSPFTEPVRIAMNAALPGNPIPGIESATDATLTQLGVAEPENAIERGVQSVGRFVTGVGAGGAITNVAARGMGIRPPAQQPATRPPTTEQLRQYAQQAYQTADNAGVVLSPQSFGARVAQISQDVAKEGIDPTLHPRATAALQRLTEAVQQGPLTLQQAETLRRVVKNAAASIQPDERRIARIMTDALDDYVMTLKPADVVGGDPAVASQALNAARGLWSRMSKGEVVEGLIERARTRAGQFSGSGYENALRTEFRQLVMNPKRLRLFTPAEQEALKRVANGGPLENAARWLGKLAPTGVVSTTLGSGAGYALGGPVGGVAVPALGFAGRETATRLTQRNALMAAELMRRGYAPVASRTNYLTQPQTIGAIGPVNALLAPEEDRAR